MNKISKPKKVDELFIVKSGDFHAIHELDSGDIPLISCADTDNGVIGYFDIPEENVYKRALTVAYNGSWPLMTKFHPYKFGAKDDVAVLTPRKPMKDMTLLYVAALLNMHTWRYSYGRKCFREKLQKVSLIIPIVCINDEESIDEKAISEFYPKDILNRFVRQLALINI